MGNKVVYLGALSDVTGKRQENIEEMSSVHELFKHLVSEYPDLRLKSFKIFVNDEEINHERPLADGEEVVLVDPHLE